MARDRVVSIDIGTYSTKIVEGRANSSVVTLEKAFMFETPQHAISDGRIIDGELIKNEIANRLTQNKVNAKKVIFTFESTAVIRRELELPLVKYEEMDSMVRYEVEQYLPIVISDYVIEYKLLEEFTEGEVKKCRVSVAALPKMISEEYLKLSKDLKLLPTALDINSNSIAKLFGAKAQINGENYSLEKTAAIIDYGHNSSNLVIISKGVPRLNRLMGSGGREIDLSIANTFSLDLQDAREKKHKVKRLTSSYGTGDSDQLEQAARQSLDEWMTELQRLFQFYNSRGNNNRIDEIYIYGGGSKLGGLSDYIKGTFSIPVYIIERHSNIKQMKEAAEAELGNYLNAIGAIIRK